MSTFITTIDYDSSIYAEILNTVIRNDATALEVIEDQAIAEMRSYLSARFDCDAIFAATGTARNMLVLMFAKDITLYHAFSIYNPLKMSQMRKDRYDKALEWLKGVMKGDLSAEGLPPKTDDQDPSGSNGTGIMMSSNLKRSNHY